MIRRKAYDDVLCDVALSQRLRRTRVRESGGDESKDACEHDIVPTYC